MKPENKVFIAQSLDGYIADKDGGLEWLHAVPNPDHLDLGYEKFQEGIDAILLGRTTFEVVCSFDMEWPYKLPVFVLSNTLNSPPDSLKDKVEMIKGPIPDIMKHLHQKGYYRLYIDGGATIQSFLKEDLIDELIITRIPILLGGGIPLFRELPNTLDFEHVESVIYLDALVQDTYRRKR